MSVVSAQTINQLLEDKLYQVVGSTPASVAESLRKIDLKGRAAMGGQIFAVSIFAAAVNRATMESFLADERFASVRPALISALSINGKANMTALTLLGHCFMTTKFADNVTFATEFRRKMGQDHLWAGDLKAGSLSDKQKEILQDKKRVGKKEEAEALGNGFLKLVGLLKEPMTALEMTYFPSATSSVAPTAASASAARSATVARPRTPPAAVASTQSKASVSPSASPTNVDFKVSQTSTVSIPEDVLNYRRNILGQSDDDITESIERNGLERFISNTRRLIERDPTGKGVASASVVGR